MYVGRETRQTQDSTLGYLTNKAGNMASVIIKVREGGWGVTIHEKQKIPQIRKSRKV